MMQNSSISGCSADWKRRRLPEAIRLEVQFDVEPDARSLVGGPAWND
jgi:hypothetical protein